MLLLSASSESEYFISQIVTIRFTEQGGIEIVKFLPERAAAGEAEIVDVLREAFSRVEQVHVIGDAAYEHIGFEQIHLIGRKTRLLEVLLALREGEGFEQDAPRDPVVQAAPVFEKFLYDPRRRRPADDKAYIVTRGGSIVPEMLQRRNEPRPLCVEPRHFVDKDDFLLPVRPVQQSAQPLESVAPCVVSAHQRPDSSRRNLCV
ncbi:MAG: hypothetical protein LBS67_01080 [Clostridiales Family XIII bacterium]|nr:hypothetical protein [Clostridiales Family XIII bacterium]